MAVQDTTQAVTQPAEDVSEGRTVGTKEQLGAGVIALGIFALLMPWASGEIAALVDGAEPYTILSGSVMVLGLFILAAGIAIIVQRMDD